MSKQLTNPPEPPVDTLPAPPQVAASVPPPVRTNPSLPAVLSQRWSSLSTNGRIVVSLGSIVGPILIVAIAFLAIGQAVSPGTQPSASVPQVAVPAHQIYNAAPPAAPQGETANITLEVKESLISVAPGVAYNAWTFNGTVPGPILRVRQGQTVNFTLINRTNTPHSIDFHAAQTAWNVNYQPIAPGKSFTFSWRANVPGVFMYHCGMPPVMVHMANGMYGAILVDPSQGWPPAKEYVLVQSEFYMHQLPNGSYGYDDAKAMSGIPDEVVFNGYANQYKDAPLTAGPSQKMRLFIVNAGPSTFSAFHVIGAIFSDYYESGDPNNHMHASQTLTIPPGGGMVAELTIPDSGSYPFVTHAFSAAMKGATGVIQIK